MLMEMKDLVPTTPVALLRNLQYNFNKITKPCHKVHSHAAKSLNMWV